MNFKAVIILPISFIAMLNLTACQSLPSQPHLAKSELLLQSALPVPSDISTTPNLITAISHDNAQHPNQSGYFPLITGADAFATRSILTNLATKSIDVQYYIWHDDEAGQLMLKDLYNAANRGVKVRLLLDDLNTNPQLDQQLLAFAQHPNVAVRLMNPKKYRQFTPLNYVTALPRFGRRMHNKSMTFDNQISIVGGRNIGDEYLRSDKATQFADLDVMLVGQVVSTIDTSFEQYWQNGLAYDIETLVTANKEASQPFLQTLNKINTNPHQLTNSANIYEKAIADSTINTDILSHRVPFRWTTIEFLSDDPTKLSKKAAPNSYLIYKMREKMGEPKQQFTLISSYFVPNQQGTAELVALAKKGVKVKILTNSFSATDVGIVHSGYINSRKALLKAGIELYELKTSANINYANFPKTINPSQPFHNRIAGKFAQTNLGKKFPKRLSNKQPKAQKSGKIRQNVERRPSLKRANIITSLHTKAFAVDNDKVFIGSYNTDPRSANINTELGVIIHDSQLASQLHNAIGQNLLSQAYQVTLDTSDKLQWQTYPDDAPHLPAKQNFISPIITTAQEPKMSLVNRIWVRVFSFLPIKWLL